MKTPRELLLDEHRHIDGELDRLRHLVVSQLRAPRPTSAREQPGAWLARVGEELIRPYQRGWVVVGSAWLIILGLNLTIPSGSLRPQPLHSTLPNSSVSAELREQSRLRAELLLLESPSIPAKHLRQVPGPQGSRRVNAVSHA